MMEPLTITAHLASPPSITGPLLLDGMLLAGLGAKLGETAPSGWADVEEIMAQPLPLARVEVGDDWWYAASQATPHGPEEKIHLHRRPFVEQGIIHGAYDSINVAVFPDKAMRVPLYRRLAMMTVEWTCVGDAREIGGLLARVPCVGRHHAHGHGWVTRWQVERGGPPLDAYRRDVSLRPIPTTVQDAELPPHVSRRRMPITPPYWDRARGVSVWQIAEVPHARHR